MGATPAREAPREDALSGRRPRAAGWSGHAVPPWAQVDTGSRTAEAAAAASTPRRGGAGEVPCSCPVITSSWRALFRENADCSYARSSPFVGQGLVPCRPSAPTQVGAPEVGWPIIHPTGGLLVQLPASCHEYCEIWHRGWPCGRGQAPALRNPWMMARVARWMAEPRCDHWAVLAGPPAGLISPHARRRQTGQDCGCLKSPLRNCPESDRGFMRLVGQWTSQNDARQSTR